jgi:hypothetical protein
VSNEQLNKDAEDHNFENEIPNICMIESLRRYILRKKYD